MSWNPPSLRTTGDLITASIWNTDLVGDLLLLKTEIGNTGIVQRAQSTRRLHIRTHPDSDKGASQVQLLGLEEVVMNDGARYSGLSSILPLTADLTTSGAGGLDTGSRVASVWYELYLIGKSSTKAIADLRLLFHRAKDYFTDQSFTTAFDASRPLRVSTSTATDKLAQGITFATAGKLEFATVTLTRNGAPTGNCWFTLESDNAGSPSGTVLATSMKFDVAKIQNTALSFVLVPFYTPATVSASTQYHLVLQGDFTRSDTVNVSWGGVAAGGYAGGSAKQFNGTTWAAATGVGDFQFTARITRNDTALTFPSGYDESVLLVPAYNTAGNALLPFVARDRRVSLSAQAAIASISATYPTLADCGVVLPPYPCDAFIGALGSVVNTNFVFSGGPDGYTLYDNLYPGLSQREVQAVSNVLYTPTTSVPTDFQHLYFYVNGNSASFYCGGFQW